MRGLALLCVPWLLLAGAGALGLGCGSDDAEGTPASGGSGGAAGASGASGEAGAAGQDAGPTGPRSVVLLYTSDEHSNIFASSPERDDWPMATEPGTGVLVGGVARRATILAAQRASAKTAGKPTVTMSAGDNAMGTLVQVVRHTQSYEWRLMKRLGYDVTGLGNHDFDLGLGNLAGAIQVAKDAGELPPIVSSNIHFSADSADDDVVAKHMSETAGDSAALHRYHVLQTDNGLRIGFISYLGVDASMKAPFKAPIAFSEVAVSEFDADDPEKVLPYLYSDLQPIVDKLRNDEKVDLVVALSHAGLSPEKPSISEDDKIAANVSGIDVIISGHAHEHGSEPLVVHNETSGRDVVVLNGGDNGAFVGRIELTVPASASDPITWDKATQALLPVDDETVPEPGFVDDLRQALEAMESDTSAGGVSPIAQLLVRAGASVTNDPSVAGDLYFHQLASTAFDLPGKRPLAFLTADAQQAMLDQLNLPVQIALQSSGVIRSELLKGKTGSITLADAFRVVPLGTSPTDNSVGYPLVRVKIASGALRALFDLGSGRGPADSSYDITGSGVSVEIDCTRAAIASTMEVFDVAKGRVMKIWIDADHTDGYEQADTLVWDRDNPPSSVFGGPLIVVSTTTYMAQVMAAGGVPLFDMNDKPVKPNDAIVTRPGDGSEVKELDAFFSYMTNTLGGKLPDTYDPSSPNATKRFKSFAFCP